MIILWGLIEDGPLAAVARCLSQLRAPVTVIDQRRVLDYNFEWRSNCGRITGPDVSIDMNEASAIYLRQYNFENLDALAGEQRGSDLWRRAAEFEDSILAWSEVADARVVNRPSAMGSNNSKPFQLEIIRECGFLVPDTLITSNPDCVLEFREKHKRIIYKSISSCRSIVSQVGEDDLRRIADVTCCPTQFQQFVDGTDFRVHVLEDKVFVCSISCPDDDYRYSRRAIRQVASLPLDLIQKCIDVTQKLGLLFSGIDLRRSADGAWYCFEVNPSPGFTYFESEPDEISLEFAKFLAA